MEIMALQTLLSRFRLMIAVHEGKIELANLKTIIPSLVLHGEISHLFQSISQGVVLRFLCSLCGGGH